MELKLSPKQKNNYSVYIHTNKTSGKVYIGITKQVPERRWQNGHGYEGTYFGNAIKKYGWDGFEHSVIVTGISKEKACEMEKNLIALYKANERQHGYNIAEGGQTCDCITVKSGIEHPNHQRVKMIDPETGEVLRVFGAQAEAARELGINRKGITKACQGISATYKGYVWEYADKHYKKPANVGIGNYDHSKRRKPVAVVFPDGTKKNFSCVKEASERLGVNYNTARRYAIDNVVDKEGRGWCYES